MKYIIYIFLLLILWSCSSQPPQPNIIFIVADDMGPWTLSINGDPNTYTPQLDKLAQSGARFHNFYATGAVCSPTRASLITGRYPSETGVTDYIPQGDTLGVDLSLPMFPKLLQDKGYSTIMVGKWHLGSHQEGFWPTQRGYDRFTGFPHGGMQSMSPRINVEGEWQVAEGAYTPDLLTETAMDYLDDFHPDKTGKPVMLSLHYWAPHANTDFPPGMEPEYEGRSWLPMQDVDLNRWRNEEMELPDPGFPNLDMPLTQRMAREYYSSVHSVDRNVGRLMDHLEKLGMKENTIVVFTSDHGYMMGHNGLWHKGNGRWLTKDGKDPSGLYGNSRPNLYDNSMRVPCIISWPGNIAPDTEIDQTATFVDFFPTILEMTGIRKPRNLKLRGNSIVPLLKGNSWKRSNENYAEYINLRAWRTEKYKLVLDFSPRNLHELYNLETDPEEKHNLYYATDDEVVKAKQELTNCILNQMQGIKDPLLEKFFLNGTAFQPHSSTVTSNPQPATHSHTAKQPHSNTNFLIILIDDLGSQDLGCYGQKIIQTPQIDKLAEQGMRWTNAYSACPVCSPTRAALLTGKSTARVHFTGHITAIGRHRYPENGRIIPPDDLMYLPHEEVLISEALKPLGYKSISIGKWHVGHEGYWPTDQGFDQNIAGWTHGNPPSHFYPYKADKDWNPAIPTMQGGVEGEYLADRLTDEAIRFLEGNKDHPFLLYLPHYGVHTPLEAPAELVEKYKPMVKGTGINPVYAAMVENMDSNTGRLLKRLEELGLAENTVVIFASDNGAVESTSDNSPYKRGKGHLYEGGIRVPFIVRWPGHTGEGTFTENFTISQDIFSTIVDIAGAWEHVPDTIDGRSLVPDMKGIQVTPDLFWYYPHYSPQSKIPGAAVRSGKYKLIQFYDPVRTELYDLEKDIGETTNLADAMPEKVKEMTLKLENWLEESGTIRHSLKKEVRGER